MAVMNEIKKLTKGADLTHPKLSLGWIVAAVVAVILLLVAFKAGSFLFEKGAAKVKPLIDRSTNTGSAPAVHYLS